MSQYVPWRTGDERLKLAIVRQRGDGAAVLYVHGATFPASMSVGWCMQGVSWLDHLQESGFDAWGFDFAGYGGSSRPAALAGPADAAPPFGDSVAAAAQIIEVLEHIHHVRPNTPIHVVAHSWGTLPARRVAAERPDLIQRLVLFGPVATRAGDRNTRPEPAWQLITSAMQRPRQREGMPDALPTPVTAQELERWCDAYLATDGTSASRAPASVKVPNGPMADIARMWAGERLVDSGRVKQPTLIIRGEWDDVTTDSDAQRLFAELGAAEKRDIKIAGGNHWLHLQPQRTALWAEVTAFLKEPA
ncbi:alpha/beta hydrolase [Lysobacter sp. KIS68-7]|uniref:alpha/beta fold hydrolase n=1 Tax=Lysobacter sp. KIS68-7 TaxID=2904252 RepID=UPI001E3FB79A|nr:alpha/beta fold hydrolase [Lysobacter sp. KIS68-7]UHQ18837.1 alpha/beta hydrolase [Lysobacter sp. KIS68-7]